VFKTTPSTKILQSQIEPQLFTTAPIEAPKGLPAAMPIWIDLPRSGERCRYTSLSRSALNALILGKNPPVKSVSLRKQYAVRGKRLIHLGSLLDYIEGKAAAQGNQPGKEVI
jgi:hypothetical protein